MGQGQALNMIFCFNRHALDVFFSARCYEWVFLLALVLKKFTIANEVIRLLKSQELGANLRTSIRKGLDELEEWSHNEW